MGREGEFGYPGNNQWNKSVHNSDKSAAEMEEEQALKKKLAKEEWKAKLCVENTHFSVVNGRPEDQRCIIHKYQDLLRDAPKKAGLLFRFVKL